jgi:hypothetical protein
MEEITVSGSSPDDILAMQGVIENDTETESINLEGEWHLTLPFVEMLARLLDSREWIVVSVYNNVIADIAEGYDDDEQQRMQFAIKSIQKCLWENNWLFKLSNSPWFFSQLMQAAQTRSIEDLRMRFLLPVDCDFSRGNSVDYALPLTKLLFNVGLLDIQNCRFHSQRPPWLSWNDYQASENSANRSRLRFITIKKGNASTALPNPVIDAIGDLLLNVLSELSLDLSGIGDEEMIKLSSYLANDTTLNRQDQRTEDVHRVTADWSPGILGGLSLSFDDNCFTEVGAQALNKAMKQSSRVHKLKIRDHKAEESTIREAKFSAWINRAGSKLVSEYCRTGRQRKKSKISLEKWAIIFELAGKRAGANETDMDTISGSSAIYYFLQNMSPHFFKC